MSTVQRNASADFRFIGTGIEWFGTTDKRHGTANVYIDGRFIRNVDAWRNYDNPRTQQRIFSKLDLPQGAHSFRIVNLGGGTRGRGELMDLDALVVTKGRRASVLSNLTQSLEGRDGPAWTLREQGNTGVNAMQLAVVSPTHVLVVDKVEHNPLDVNGHPAWGALYNLETHEVTPLNIQSNSFCAGGSFLSNGTMINVGGNPVVESYTSSAEFGDLNGLQAIRLFHPCDDDSSTCDLFEDHDNIRMASPRWYNTVLRISDGSAMIIGGSRKGGWINNATVSNPTLEYYPPKNIHGYNGMPIPLPFLEDTLNSNLFPIAFSLPNGRIFVAANQDAMIYDWKTNTESRLPRIPNGVRVTYPMAGTGLLLPLSPENNYQPEVLICGGSAIDDRRASYDISSQEAASAQCSRIVLTEDGIARGWQTESMPQPRLMPDAVLLPTGDVLIVNGAASGIAGYGNVRDQVGASNADNPVLTPVLYSPTKEAGARFSSDGMPASDIPRLYHSTATLTPNGEVMIAGSNPNLDRSDLRFGTEYRVEWLSPPYMQQERPEIVNVPGQVRFGERISLEATLPVENVKVALMDLGYVTHSVHANSRLVYLNVVSQDGGQVEVEGPPNGDVYPPGPGWLFVVAGGVPSEGVKVMIGDGNDPPFDQGALDRGLKASEICPPAVLTDENSRIGKDYSCAACVLDGELGLPVLASDST
ncbi:copper radical oxidase [Coprinopsis cinerea okayama7|uniref:Copper radical oxidase n=1 Tax=Coprinopsis cinerea (strain Okayama-7 / 130 / ATCC MYA-4618 / FGSC 9003) TaxID=240176 RepID=A8NEY3_COPC7|nr:copper radical oxidase [Coprinopsis cinerea okayama7\|eukprot:XP_001833162.2 copper radical oxidase [Coprinopsis cinerea okayama7\